MTENLSVYLGTSCLQITGDFVRTHRYYMGRNCRESQVEKSNHENCFHLLKKYYQVNICFTDFLIFTFVFNSFFFYSAAAFQSVPSLEKFTKALGSPHILDSTLTFRRKMFERILEHDYI